MLTRRILAAVLLIGVLIVLGVVWRGSNGRGDEVVVYVSHDQVFSEPILKDFERDTGIHVRAMFDTEETKSAGLMNRLLAEKDRPQADVYWANEPIRADVLRQRSVAAPYRSASAEGIPAQFRDPNDYWTGFSARARMLILDRRLEHKPASIRAYTDRQFRGQAVIANPLFGTTTAHIAALFTVWGDAQAKAFLQAMRANGVRVASSNGDSADQVAKGAAQFALVDSDDVFSRQKEGQPIESAYPDQEAGRPGLLHRPQRRRADQRRAACRRRTQADRLFTRARYGEEARVLRRRADSLAQRRGDTAARAAPGQAAGHDGGLRRGGREAAADPTLAERLGTQLNCLVG